MYPTRWVDVIVTGVTAILSRFVLVYIVMRKSLFMDK